jgi:hypothetical protein
MLATLPSFQTAEELLSLWAKWNCTLCPGGRDRHDCLLHLVRVSKPVPTARHPLCGLWKADYGQNGIQIVQVSYDFSGSAARIVAIKVGSGRAYFPTLISLHLHSCC